MLNSPTEYLKHAPITCTLFVINVVIFLLNKFGIISSVVSVPRSFELYTFFAHFSHMDLLHFGFNMFILLQISPLIEQKISGIFYTFFLFFLWMFLVYGGYIFASGPALGFSGIGLGLLMFCGLLYRNNAYFSQQILSLVGINVLIGLLPGISFLMHFLGALGGLLLYGIYKIISHEK